MDAIARRLLDTREPHLLRVLKAYGIAFGADSKSEFIEERNINIITENSSIKTRSRKY